MSGVSIQGRTSGFRPESALFASVPVVIVAQVAVDESGYCPKPAKQRNPDSDRVLGVLEARRVPAHPASS